MEKEKTYIPKVLAPQNTRNSIEGSTTNLTHDELPDVNRDSNVKKTVIAVPQTIAEKPVGGTREEKEKEPKATLLLSGYGQSGTNPHEWFKTDIPNCGSIEDYATFGLKDRISLYRESGPFIWIERTGKDFRVYSCCGSSRDLFPATRGCGILPTVVEGVIVPVGLIKPQSLEHLDVNPAPELKKLNQLFKEYDELKERETEIEKNIREIETKFLGKLRSKGKKKELEILQDQIKQKWMDISKVKDALARAEKGKPLTAYETKVTSIFLNASQNPNSTTEIPLHGQFSALTWFKKLQGLAKDKN